MFCPRGQRLQPVLSLSRGGCAAFWLQAFLATVSACRYSRLLATGTPILLSTMSKTRIAVAGAGLIGQAHIRVLQASTTCALSAVVDPSPAAAAVAAQAGVPLFARIDELLAQDRPDGLLLAKPHALHVPQALQCIAAGLPVLVEKPIATSVAEGQTLVDAAERSGVPVLIGHHRAHSPIMAKARQVVQSGQLGRLVAVMGSATSSSPTPISTTAPGAANLALARSCST